MKSTSSALTPRKIAEYCKGRFTSVLSEREVRLLYGCLVDLLERAEYPPYRGSGLDLPSLSAMLDIDVERLRAHRAHLQPIFDAVAREVSNVTLRPARTASRSIRSKANTPSANPADVPATSIEKVRKKPGVWPRAIVEFPEPLDTAWSDPATFGEALQLHARRHGETIYHLYNAVVRPEDGVHRSTLISWGRGKKVPRAAISLEILGRIERRYRLTSTNAAYCQNTFYEAWRTAIQRYGIYNPWTKRGAIEGLLPHGPHNVRDVLATHILKRTGSYEQASYAIQDTPDMVAQHYGRFLPQDKSEIAARILNQVWEAA